MNKSGTGFSGGFKNKVNTKDATKLLKKQLGYENNKFTIIKFDMISDQNLLRKIESVSKRIQQKFDNEFRSIMLEGNQFEYLYVIMTNRQHSFMIGELTKSGLLSTAEERRLFGITQTHISAKQVVNNAVEKLLALN